MRKTKLDDGFHSYLVKDADLVGDAGIPRMIDLHNTSTPKSLIPFEKCKYTKNYHQYIHFYMHDKFLQKFSLTPKSTLHFFSCLMVLLPLISVCSANNLNAYRRQILILIVQ